MVSIIPHDPTNLCILSTLLDIYSYGEQMLLSTAELAYQAIQSTSDSSIVVVTTNGTTSEANKVPSTY